MFVDPDDALLDRVLARVPLAALQLHGAESPDRVRAIKARTGCAVIKALQVAEARDLAAVPSYAAVADMLLFDARPPKDPASLPGGNGLAFDWRLLEDLRVGCPWLLSGGLSADNLAAAVMLCRPPAVDVSSGVEFPPRLQGPGEDPALPRACPRPRHPGARHLRNRPEFASMTLPNTYRAGPDARGRFGIYGGRFVAETLMPLILELEDAYEEARDDPAFQAELAAWLADYAGRPTPLYLAERLSTQLGGARVYFKRDELTHTGAHKINNTIGQILLARRMGKRRIIAETGAGQHGVATATVAARLGLECVVYMGERDIERQRPNVFRMRLLGAEVRAVKSGSATLKDAMNEALRDWVSHVDDTFYIIGTVAGPHPYPAMVRDFQCVIGNEVRAQITAKEGRLPDTLVACIGGGSNAIGLFHPFLDEPEVRMIGVEAAGHGIASGEHAAALSAGQPGVLHGSRSYLLQDDDGQVIEAHSISAGLDYPGVGPEHAWLKDVGRVEYVPITDEEALGAFRLCSELEGILPALEPAHALAHVVKIAPDLPRDHLIVMNLCGRGDKDIFTVADAMGVAL